MDVSVTHLLNPIDHFVLCNLTEMVIKQSYGFHERICKEIFFENMDNCGNTLYRRKTPSDHCEMLNAYFR